MATETAWGRLVSRLFPSSKEHNERLNERIHTLDAAVRRNPESAAAYLARGEALLDAGESDAAQADFRQALMLAEAQFKTETWGIVAQSVRDRALRGLQQVRGESR